VKFDVRDSDVGDAHVRDSELWDFHVRDSELWENELGDFHVWVGDVRELLPRSPMLGMGLSGMLEFGVADVDVCDKNDGSSVQCDANM
jgi:hypothetical protein